MGKSDFRAIAPLFIYFVRAFLLFLLYIFSPCYILPTESYISGHASPIIVFIFINSWTLFYSSIYLLHLNLGSYFLSDLKPDRITAYNNTMSPRYDMHLSLPTVFFYAKGNAFKLTNHTIRLKKVNQ